MKKIRIFLLVAAVACLTAGCSRPQKFTVQGTLKDIKFPKADSVRMESSLLAKPVIVPVNDRAFALRGKVKEPTIGKIFAVGTKRRNAHFLILEKGAITFQDGLACGTPLNDSTFAFTHRLRELNKKYPAPVDREVKQKAIEMEFTDFVARHKDDPCATYAILLGHKRLSPDALLRLIRTASTKIQNDDDVHALKKNLSMGK